MSLISPRVTCVVLAALLVVGCSGITRSSGDGPSPISADSAAVIEAIYLARTDSARSRFTEADVRFMTRMIGHHAQALEMAALAPARTEDSQIRTLAARIINAQRDEIATMQQWLRDRGQPVPDPDSLAAHGTAHQQGGTPAMPGMVTPEQFAALEAARGLEFDRRFLTLMIQHHAGAVVMVEELFATDGAGQDEEAFKIASDAQVDQRTEIDRMELMLSRMGGVDRQP